MKKDSILVWMDLEMTGLDPETCVIVELAMILTDRQLNPVGKPLNIAIWQPESALSDMEPFVRDMHTRSGLLERVRNSRHSLRMAEKQVLEVLTQYSTFGTSPLCGNSIGQDRRFLVKYMPQVEGYLHYRNIDVSTVKELALWWYEEKYQKPDNGKHTATHDIQQSLEELRFLRKRIFV